MNKNLNHKGASKRKGAAESEELTEKGPVDGMDESGAGKKKGAAQDKKPQDYGISPISGKPYAKGVSDEQKAKDKAKAKAGAKKKGGAAQVDFGNIFGPDTRYEDAAIKAKHGGKKGSINPQGKEMAGFNFTPPTNGTKGVSSSGNKLQKGKTMNANKPDLASKIYDVDQDGDSVFQDYNQDGTMLGRGLQSVSNFLTGAKRTGFTQNFGAARQNGYAKGAAKVASIMSFGAAKAKGAAEYGGKKGDDSKSKKDYEG